MFTGIVEILAKVHGVIAEAAGRQLEIEADWIGSDTTVGDSIAINGVCLTAVACERGLLSFQVGPETLARTNLGDLRPDDRVNLERALLPTTRIGGHFVQGHIDGVAIVEERRREAEWEWVAFVTDSALSEQMVPRGSVAVDGVSLTLLHVSPGKFSVMLIPHTLANSTLGFREVGSTVNIETDILGKYVLQSLGKLPIRP